MKKTGRKRESSARSATSALTISGVGIRSTVIIWTGQRNLAARGNLRDGRGPLPRLSPLLSLSPSLAATRPNSHSNTPNRVALLPLSLPRCNADPTKAFHPRRVHVRVCVCENSKTKIVHLSFTPSNRARKREDKEKEEGFERKKKDSKISSFPFHLHSFVLLSFARNKNRCIIFFFSREKLDFQQERNRMR